MTEIDFLGSLHSGTKRDYLGRVNERDKAECAELAKRWDRDYWDGDRATGYGGMRYDGRWRPVAEKMAAHYGIKPGYRILDVGCGKGFLLYEFTQVVPGVEVAGIDISDYAIEHAKEEVKPARPLFSRGQRVSSLGAGRGERRGGAGVCGGIDAIVAVTQG
ncbi:MAG: hypothetical protein CL471_00770 [Acidobacteria bacterium]|nr:hypothetical protein [Acidobacteriota bacterium]